MRNEISSETYGRVGWQEVADAFRLHRRLAIAVFAATLILSVIAAFVMPPIYRSEVLLVPASSEKTEAGLASMLGKLGGLAGAVGVNLPTDTDSTAQQAVELLGSRGFLSDFLNENGLLPILYADDWDAGKGAWKVDAEDVPTLNEGVEKFRRRILSVEQAPSGLVRVRVDWTDPQQAADWANGLVAMLNDRARQRDLAEAERSVAYLQEQLQKTKELPIRDSISRLMAEALNKAMLASVRREYVFEVLDAAAPADDNRPLRPRKGLFIALGFLAGLAFAALAVAVRSAFTPSKSP